ncbi:DUF1328 domain-containing protein [Halomicroarcula sp. GCM10025709]|uniref:DUF1328 domain-containing protein n=1 Tax=Haloarcula TaxID=2237 RepID=UPI003613A8D5
MTFEQVTSMPLVMSGEFLQWAVVFFVIAIVAAIVGARGVAGVTMTVAKWFVIIFLVLALVSLLL